MEQIMATVLIVDDEKSIRVTLREFLVNDGYEVRVASDADEAFQLIGAHKFDVVISDIVLPAVSGIDLLKAIRGRAPFAQVIMMTGEPTVDSAAEALRAGAFDYLVKPVSRNAVLRGVRNAARVKAAEDERQRLEQENQRYRGELEQRVAERTAELEAALTGLRTAQGEIVRHERLNALAQLAAGICHDFNNSLLLIRGFAEILVSCPEVLDNREEALGHLRSILSASDDAEEIVRRMSEFYRPADALEMEVVDLEALLDSVVELTRPRWHAQAAGAAIQMVCEYNTPLHIVGNPCQLREALMNLILNAVDSMPRGGSITLSAGRSEQAVTISVTDTGEGMPDEVQQRCLEPFFSTKGERGTGMGLAMVHGIVERHGGALQIESALSKGTTVRMRIPLPDNGHVLDQPMGERLVLGVDATLHEPVIERRIGETGSSGRAFRPE